MRAIAEQTVGRADMKSTLQAQYDLTRCRSTKRPGNKRPIIQLLKTVGVPDQMLYARPGLQNASFWMRPIDHLGVLEKARQLYRTQIVEVHPDKAGGCLEQAILLNDAWGKIQKRFKKHGHELW